MQACFTAPRPPPAANFQARIGPRPAAESARPDQRPLGGVVESQRSPAGATRPATACAVGGWRCRVRSISFLRPGAARPLATGSQRLAARRQRGVEASAFGLKPTAQLGITRQRISPPQAGRSRVASRPGVCALPLGVGPGGTRFQAGSSQAAASHPHPGQLGGRSSRATSGRLFAVEQGNQWAWPVRSTWEQPAAPGD